MNGNSFCYCRSFLLKYCFRNSYNSLGISARSYSNDRDGDAAKLEQLLLQMKANKIAEPAINDKLARPVRKPGERSSQNSRKSEILQAVSKVADKAPKGLKKKVEEDLVARLQSHSSSAKSLKELFSEMKVEKESSMTRGGKVKLLIEDNLQQHGIKKDYVHKKYRVTDSSDSLMSEVNKSAGLNMFDAKNTPKPISLLKTWNCLYQKELELLITHPPSNGFEEHILWTEQGKLWHFPIDNEQGMEEEKAVGFHEHIFLNKHLSPWCPKTGPVAHFMELVCVGLSKNPYLTVNEKKEHISWYKNYFDQHKHLLDDA